MKAHHPLTSYIPMTADYDELVMDIAQSGVHEPVILYEGKVVEGRVRQAAAKEAGTQPQYRDWVLFGKGDPLDWMLRFHVETHKPNQLGLIRLAANVLPLYQEMKGATHKRIGDAIGLGQRKVRAVDWLQQAGRLQTVLDGEQTLNDAGRALGIVSEKRSIALGKAYGHGDKFDESTQPLKRYLAAWRRKGYEFRHINPKEAARRLTVIDQLLLELAEAKRDIANRSVASTLSAPPERSKGKT